MSWLVTGIVLLLLVYPFQRAENYFRSSFESSRGWTRIENHERYSKFLLTLAQMILLVALGILIWGVMEVFISDQAALRYLDMKAKDVTESTVNVMPAGGGK